MKKSDIRKPSCYFDRYINHVEDIELVDAFQQSYVELDQLDFAAWHRIGDNVYASDKWTIKDTLQHLIDTEHILAYRALRIGRNDKTNLPGFEESLLAAHVSTKQRTLESLIEELKIVRCATELLFASFDDDALQHIGFASNIQMSALAFGFTILGHQKHHLNIIAEKYMPLMGKEAAR